MKTGNALLGAVILAGSMLATAGLASAAEPLVEESAIPGEFSANVALTSEYYFRGLSQTDDAPAIQGGFDYSVDIAPPASLYLGVWGSNVDFNDGADGATVETDLYGGLNGSIGDTGISWDAGLIYYAYPGAASSLDYDFYELQGSLGYDFGVASTTASLNYSPDNFGDSGKAYYPKLALEVPVGPVTLDGYIARQYIEKNDVFGVPDYTEWNLSATTSIAGFDATVAYSDTNISGDPDGQTGAVIFTIARSF